MHRGVSLITVLVFFLSACTGMRAPGDAAAAPGKIKVVATFSILADFVRNIAGDAVTITTLVGAEGDTHDYEPTPADSKALADSAVIVENGLGFESWLDKLYSASGTRALRIITSAGIQPRIISESGVNETDPHIWLSIDNAILIVKNIATGLIAADPAHADQFRRNSAAYTAQLIALNHEVETAIAGLPLNKRNLVTTHDSLGYFADRYGFKVIGSVIASVSTEAGEPSAQDFARIVDVIRSTGTKAIFLESISNPALIERVAHEAGVVIAPKLYTDALGANGSDGATYIDALRHDTQVIVQALKN